MFETRFESPLGMIEIITDKGRLLFCNWLHEDCKRKMGKILARLEKNESPQDREVALMTIEQLGSYFEGSLREFNLPLRAEGTEFQKQVWNAILKINYADTVSYKELGVLCGHEKAIRAVANACGANPISLIIPCHRITAADGNPGGYTGGPEKKEWLLRHEKNFHNYFAGY